MAPETKIEECECKTCGNKFQGEVTVYPNFKPPREVRLSECPKCKAVREAREEQERQEELERERQQVRERWRAQANLPQGLQCTRFEEWDQSYNRHAYGVCVKWAKGFDIETPRVSKSLLLYSEVAGVGKTSLMVCIANYIIDNWKGDPRKAVPLLTRFESGPGLVRRIRNTYNLRQGDDSHEREEDVYNQLSGVKFLILDDVGKETPSRFTCEVYWYLINERLTKGLPVLITSRLPIGDASLPELMGEDTVDRIYGMCRGEYESLKGPSYRREKKVP